MIRDELFVGSLEELVAAATGDQPAVAFAAARGREVIESWIADGTLVDATEASRRCGRAIEQASTDELVTITHAGQTYYLSSVLDLPPAAIARVNRAHGTGPGAAQLHWWTKRHGGLGAVTIAEAIRAGNLNRCVEVSRGWALEHGEVQRARTLVLTNPLLVGGDP